MKYVRGGVIWVKLKNSQYSKDPVRRSTGIRVDSPGAERASDRIEDAMRVALRDGTFDEKFPERNAATPNPGAVYLQEAADWYIKHLHQWYDVVKTANQVKNAIRYFIDLTGNIEVQKLRRADIEGFKVKRLSGGVSTATVDKDLALIGAFFNRLEEFEIIPENPVKGKVKLYNQKKARSRIASQEEMDRIYTFIHGTWFFPFVALRQKTGLRQTDILRLRVEDLDFEQRIISGILLNKTRKTSGQLITVILPDDLCDILKEYITEFQIKGLLFPVTSDACTQKFSLMMKKLGIENLELKDLRRTYSTRLWNDGPRTDMKLAADMLGQKTLDVNHRHYTKVELERMREAIESMKMRDLREYGKK